MARKRNKPKPDPEPPEPERKKVSRPGVPLHVWIDEALDEALQRFLDDTEPAVFKTAAVETALREFLRQRGYWPPKRESS